MVLMIMLVCIVVFMCWPNSDENTLNTLVVEKDTGRAVAFIYVDWDGSALVRTESIVSANSKYDAKTHDLVQFNTDTLVRYDLHLYNRE